jgi:hypothetical protein
MLGQSVVCAACKANFVLTPAQLQAPSGAGKSAPPPPPGKSSTATATLPAQLAAPPRVAPPPIAPPVASRNQLPATKPAVTAPPPTLLQPAPDGKLPTLALEQDAVARGKQTPSQGPSTLIVVATLALSMTLSLAMLMLDFTPRKMPEADAFYARQKLESFFGDEGAPPRPYQSLLRESQRAHSRGDIATERKCYKQVMDQLRSESRGPLHTLTGTAGDDAELERQLTILLRDVGETSFFP